MKPNWRVALVAWLACHALANGAQSQPARATSRALPKVSPDQLHKPEWLNKTVEVEDRISDFRRHGGKIDEIAIKGTPIPLKLAGPMRLDRPSPMPRGRFQGRVLKVGNLYQFMVTNMELLPSEREELAAKVKGLAAGDAQKRLELASWADSIGNRYQDVGLRDSALKLRSEAFKILGMKEDEPGTSPGSTAISAANDAAKAGTDPAIVRSLAHLGLEKAVQGTQDQGGLERLTREIAALLPDSTKPQQGKISDQAAERYKADPLNAYIEAGPEDRLLLDRDLLARALEKGLMEAVARAPEQLEGMVDVARRNFPDRPELADRIRDHALLVLVDKSKTLRRDDLVKLIELVRDKFGQGELAQRLARDWLTNRQTVQLAANDAEGRLSLAKDYLSMLGDKRTAAALLREAQAIDPDHAGSAGLLVNWGWKKEGDRWIDPEEPDRNQSTAEGKFPAPQPNLPGGRVANAGGEIPAAPRPSQPPATGADPQSLVGASQARVQAQFGIPDRKVRALTQGLLTEQWIYETPSSNQIVQFARRSARSEPAVKVVYLVPR